MKAVNFVKSLFANVHPGIILKSYAVSAFWLVIFFGVLHGYEVITYSIWTIVCAVLFPLSNIVINDIKAFSGGGFLVALPMPLWFAIKIVGAALVFFTTPLVAPIGILYLWLTRSKRQ